METNIWVNITFNAYDQLRGKDEFLATLKQEGIVVQERKKWYPAYYSGQEVEVLQMLINSPFFSFAVGAIAGGAFGDTIKYVIKKLFEALSRLKGAKSRFLRGKFAI